MESSQQQRRFVRDPTVAQQHGISSGSVDNEPISRIDGIVEISRPITPEVATRKCWICFEEESESEILEKGTESGWRHPCKCSLLAHEECLLTWVDETQKSSAEGINASKTIKCPQCKEAYQIQSGHSFSVRFMSFADGWITRCLLATIPLGLIKAVGITCFYYGQGAMLDVLGEERLTDLILSLKPGDEVRFLIGASAIPFSLVGSRFDLFSFVLPLIPSLVCFSDTSFIQSRRPMDSSPALWICVLPWLRNVYCFSWKRFLGPIESRWKSEAGLLKANVTEIAPGIGIRDEVVQNNPIGEEHVPFADPAAVPDDQIEDAIANRWIFIEASRLARLIAGALLLPKIAVFASRALDRIPFFRNRYPHKFQKVIIAGVSFVLFKDILSLLYLYSRAKGRSTRKILNRKPFHGST